MDKHVNKPSTKTFSKRRSIEVENLNLKDQSEKEFLEEIKTPLALKELNCITREKLNAIQNAQRKWVENLENWSTTDEIQKAQLEWIEKYSNFPKFNTIDSPEFTKHWNLPFSPPISSSDISPRRGFCVYEPGSNKHCSSKLPESRNEQAGDIKIAQLEEHKKVQYVTPEKAKVSASAFSPFRYSKSEKTDQAAKKRHITLRKKLYCLKKLDNDEPAKEKQTLETTPKSKSENSTPEKGDVQRRAARKYIQRKRVERDRQLREQREQEEKADQEQRERMERLRETQHRILVNATKKSKIPKKKLGGWIGLVDKKSEEDKPLSREMNEPPEYTGAHITGAIPFLSDRSKKNSSEDSKSLPHTPTNIADWNREINIPPSREKVISEEKIVDEEFGIFPLSPGSCSITSKIFDKVEKEQRSEILTPIRLNDLPLEKPVTPLLLSTPISSKQSKESLVSQSSLGCAYLFNSPEISSAQTMESFSQHSFIEDVEPPSKLLSNTLEDESLLNIALSVAEEKKKEVCGGDKQTNWNNGSNNTLFSPSVNMPSSSQYNLFAAISNKRLAYKELEHESPKKQLKTFPLFEDSCSQTVNLPDEISHREIKDISEKGIQCHVGSVENDMNDPVSTSDHMDSCSSSSAVKLTKSERLKKPNLILVPGRSSDPCMYSKSKYSSSKIPTEPHSRPKLSLDHSVDVMISENVQSFTKFSESTPKLKLTGYHLNDNTEQKEKPKENVTSLDIVPDSKIEQNEHEFSLSSILNSTRNLDTEIKKKMELQSKNRRKLSSEPLKELLSNYFLETVRWKGEKNRLTADPNRGNVFADEEYLLNKKSSVSDLSFPMSRDTSLAMSSSSVLQYTLKDDDMGFINFARFSLNMFMDLLKEESLRSKQQESHFRMRENSIIDKTKAEIAYLEIEKKKFKTMGNEEGVRNIRKKIRGLVIKLQQNLEDLQLVKKMEKNASRGRRRLLLEKIDLMRDQLNKQMEATRKVKKESLGSSHSSLEYRKELQNDHQIIPPYDAKNDRISSIIINSETTNRDKEVQDSHPIEKSKVEDTEIKVKELDALVTDSSFKVFSSKEIVQRDMVERATSPHRLSSDDERKKGDYSCSDTLDLLSTSSQHEKLEEKDARKMVALKVPLSPRVTLKRRHSSGSDESCLLSQTETQSDASDMETRVLALQQQLKQRKAELESLHKEYKKSQRERLIAKEQSLLSQIQAYDAYIDQVRRDLDKEKEGSEVKIVKPVIKHPKLACERRKSDTWLLQGRRGCRNSSMPSDEMSSCKVGFSKKEKEGCKNKITEDEKFLDCQAIEKFSLKTDFSNENTFIDDHSIKSVGIDSNIVSPHEDLKSKSSVDVEKSLAQSKPSERNYGVQIQKNYKQTVHNEEKHLLKLMKSNQNDEISFLKYKIDKVFSQEKSNGNSLDIHESTDRKSINNSVSTESSVTSKGSRPSIKVAAMNDTHIKKEGSNVILGSFDMEPTILIPESKGNLNEIETKKSMDNATELIKREVIESMDLQEKEENDLDDSSSRSGTVPRSNEETVQTVETGSMISSKSISEINKVGDINCVISSEVVETLSIEEVKDVASEFENQFSNTEVHQNESITHSSLVKESIKEVFEILSEVPESIIRSDQIDRSNEHDSPDNEKVPELLSDNSKGTDSSKEITEEVNTEVVETLKEVSEDVEVEDTVGISHSKNVSVDEEIASVVDSEEFSSGTSFPLPILSKLVRETATHEEAITGDASIKEYSNDLKTESVVESIHTDVSNQDQQLSSVTDESESVKTQTEDSKTDFSKSASFVEEVKSIVEESLKEIEESMKGVVEHLEKSSLNDQITSPINDHAPDDFEDTQELDRSITESLVDTTLEESFYDDLNKLKMRKKFIEADEDVDSNDSFLDDKEMYSFLKEEGKEKRVAAPLIDALQREGDSALDQVWRGIADAAVKDATDLILSRFFSRTNRVQGKAKDQQLSSKEVGDNDDDWDSEELQRRQAAEAEVLRLQQLRIDKEIEELEEEEARRYYYIRPIPDKPPPPYTPRRSSLVASVVEAAGEIWDGRTEMPTTFMAGCHLREFIWDLAAELVMRVRPSTPPPQPPWIHIRKRRPKRQIRTKEELLEEVEREAKIYLGVEERECRENLIIRWSRKRRDHVDEILVKESQEEEWEWTDYSEEENIIKNRIADAIVQDSIAAATSAIAQAFVKKFKE